MDYLIDKMLVTMETESSLGAYMGDHCIILSTFVRVWNIPQLKVLKYMAKKDIGFTMIKVVYDIIVIERNKTQKSVVGGRNTQNALFDQ